MILNTALPQRIAAFPHPILVKSPNMLDFRVLHALLSLNILCLITALPTRPQTHSTYLNANRTSFHINNHEWLQNTLIPGTEMTLHYTPVGLRVYRNPLKALYVSTKVGIDSQVIAQGRYTKLLKDAKGNQRFRHQVPDGVGLQVSNILPHELEWSDLEDLLKGLSLGEGWLFLCAEHLCDFEFSLEDGLSIGKGRTYRQGAVAYIDKGGAITGQRSVS